jgi:hypothetical protein
MKRIENRMFCLLSLIFIAMLVFGCASSDKKTNVGQRLVFKEAFENHRFDNTGMKRQVFDMNHDGQVDLWKFYTYKKASDEEGEGELMLVRQELDLNFDGRVDRFMFYNAKEELIREEIDANFDGITDRMLYYDDGLLARTEFYQQSCNSVAIDGESHFEVYPNLLRFYRKGVLTREEIDVACDGKRETVTIFNAEGSIAQVGRDNNGDGIIEEWIRY